jgi:hypothetical protein
MALAHKTQDKIYRRKRGFPSQREFPISAQKKNASSTLAPALLGIKLSSRQSLATDSDNLKAK